MFRIFLFACVFISFPAFALSDKEARDKIIEQSIRQYNGSCPCPYNRDSRGHKCGKRSAYSKPGGANPKCYHSDISDKEVKEYISNNSKN